MMLHRPDFRMLCVDPGLRGCGVAEFLGGTLVRAAYVKNPETEGRGYAAHQSLACAVYQWGRFHDLLAIEHPRVYPGSAQQKGDLNDLLDLVGVGGAIAAYFAKTTETVFPADWKGQVPKAMMTERISRSITPEERKTIEKCPASLMHNVLDAVGIGLWKLGRLNQRKFHND